MAMLVLKQVRPLVLCFSVIVCGVVAGPLVRWHFPCAWVKVEVTAESRLAVCCVWRYIVLAVVLAVML